MNPRQNKDGIGESNLLDSILKSILFFLIKRFGFVIRLLKIIIF
ncbi:hypothetical protein TPE_1015 [Treponema pedis str. T A4]|uniref:Uncharacterized protein n=1 Tax=Treponema pedis str. T A4 TaxID=1291379 RepID=S6A3F4_9SPIR|nr:hypothetical protein TPE_1015 [Treponema pedis str. T A4]